MKVRRGTEREEGTTRGSQKGRKNEEDEAARGVSLARHKIFEYDYTARVNRPVRKRAASYTRNAFTWPDGGAVGGPRGPGAREKERRDPAPREGTVRLKKDPVASGSTVHGKVSPSPSPREKKGSELSSELSPTIA